MPTGVRCRRTLPAPKTTCGIPQKEARRSDVRAIFPQNGFIGFHAFFEYVQAEFTDRVGYAGDDYFLTHGMDKFPPETTEELACQYAEQGAAVGAIYPDIMRAMFERTHALVPKEKWDEASRGCCCSFRRGESSAGDGSRYH
jgi:hypothetical protein